jgi:hypothetical protein
MIWFPRFAAFGACIAIVAFILDLITFATAPKTGNCITYGSWADHWTDTLGSVGLVAGGVAVVTGLIGTIPPGHRAFSLVMAVVGAGAGLYCVAAAIGNAICE